jgi:hypothetical protein
MAAKSFGVLAVVLLMGCAVPMRAQAAYAVAAPLSEYLIADEGRRWRWLGVRRLRGFRVGQRCW